GRLADFLHRGQEQADQHRNDGDDHQQFDQGKRGKAPGASHGTSSIKDVFTMFYGPTMDSLLLRNQETDAKGMTRLRPGASRALLTKTARASLEESSPGAVNHEGLQVLPIPLERFPNRIVTWQCLGRTGPGRA